MRATGKQIQVAMRNPDGALPREYGERWHQLWTAMQRPKRYAAWLNPFAAGTEEATILLEQNGLRRLPGAAGAAHLWGPIATAMPPGDAPEARALLPRPPTCATTGLKLYYPLDLASALPALALLSSAAPGWSSGSLPARVLDACAAPGGKLLILAGGGARLLAAVERDKFRFGRLRQNLRLYLPQQALARVRVELGDASNEGALRRHGVFGAVLVDAPCSAERDRLLRAISRQSSGQGWSSTSAADMDWDARQARSNASRQKALLHGAMRRAPHGHVVYATCALSHLENDDVVREVLRTAPPGWNVARDVVHDAGIGLEVEMTEFGCSLLPDRGGWGPIYWSVLQGPCQPP
eukprot:gnl/TRDRNA2_/TRDRNA2_160866_c0_seq3.p1 gnl/TRDRNA2_/TRDRNA2_160866_c0~~gnl/TRDRNA2_/TRDRNA2_160866_c0_seq3.p1  ORF type:complete len:352 (+),score=47.57 gnl/TRDRNA2_/TRDRNA2_160866_c0_seq3:88-1143(+)